LEWLGEKNRLGRGSNLGCWGKICASGAPNDFSRSFETPIVPTHFPEEPKIYVFLTAYKGVFVQKRSLLKTKIFNLEILYLFLI
jgi:hypothetical protein